MKRKDDDETNGGNDHMKRSMVHCYQAVLHVYQKVMVINILPTNSSTCSTSVLPDIHSFLPWDVQILERPNPPLLGILPEQERATIFHGLGMAYETRVRIDFGFSMGIGKNENEHPWKNLYPNQWFRSCDFYLSKFCSRFRILKRRGDEEGDRGQEGRVLT